MNLMDFFVNEFLDDIANNFDEDRLKSKNNFITASHYDETRIQYDPHKKEFYIEYIRNEDIVKTDKINDNELYISSKKNVPSKSNVIKICSKGEENNKICIEGVVFIDGDLIIEDDVDFNGILFSKNGNIIVKGDHTLNINGILMIDNNIEYVDTSKLDINYDKYKVRKFGTNMPNYITPHINYIKENSR